MTVLIVPELLHSESDSDLFYSENDSESLCSENDEITNNSWVVLL